MRQAMVELGNAKRNARFAVRHPLPGHQHDGLQQRAVESLELPRQPAATMQVAAIVGGRQRHQDGEPVAHLAQGQTTAAMVVAGVDHDAVEPGGEARLAPEAGDLLDQGAADLLGDILGVGGGAGHPPGDAVDAVVVAAQQSLEGATVAARGPRDEVAVRVGVPLRARGHVRRLGGNHGLRVQPGQSPHLHGPAASRSRNADRSRMIFSRGDELPWDNVSLDECPVGRNASSAGMTHAAA